VGNGPGDRGHLERRGSERGRRQKNRQLKPEMFLRAVEAMMIGKITMKEPGNFGFEVAESQKTFIKF
jgi:hypothetical protein